MFRRGAGRPTEAVVVSRNDQRVLELWARGTSASPQLAERARIVLRCAEGARRSEVAAALATTPHRVGRWCRRYREAGLEGLLDGVRAGARPKIDGSLRAQVMARIEQGDTSTHAIARAVAISQPTASRLRRELALDPSTAARLPPHLRLIDPAARLLGHFDAAGHAAIVVGVAADARLSGATIDLDAPRDAARTARGQASVQLRRFLRRALRDHGANGPLVAIVHTPPLGPAVRAFLAKNPRLTLHPTGTRGAFVRILDGWLAHERRDRVDPRE